MLSRISFIKYLKIFAELFFLNSVSCSLSILFAFSECKWCVYMNALHYHFVSHFILSREVRGLLVFVSAQLCDFISHQSQLSVSCSWRLIIKFTLLEFDLLLKSGFLPDTDYLVLWDTKPTIILTPLKFSDLSLLLAYNLYDTLYDVIWWWPVSMHVVFAFANSQTPVLFLHPAGSAFVKPSTRITKVFSK